MAETVVVPGSPSAGKRTASGRTRVRFANAPASQTQPIADPQQMVAASESKPTRRKTRRGTGKGKGKGDLISKIGLRRKVGIMVGFYGGMKLMGGQTIMGVPVAAAAAVGISYFVEGNADADAASDGAALYAVTEYMAASALEKEGIKAVADMMEPYLLSLESRGESQKAQAKGIRSFLKTGQVSREPVGAPVDPAAIPAASGDAKIEAMLDRQASGG